MLPHQGYSSFYRHQHHKPNEENMEYKDWGRQHDD